MTPPSEPHVGGYFMGCRQVTTKSIPRRFLDTNLKIPSNFLEILRNLMVPAEWATPGNPGGS